MEAVEVSEYAVYTQSIHDHTQQLKRWGVVAVVKEETPANKLVPATSLLGAWLIKWRLSVPSVRKVVGSTPPLAMGVRRNFFRGEQKFYVAKNLTFLAYKTNLLCTKKFNV